MNNMGLKVLPVILFLLLSIFLWRGLSLDPHHLPSVQIGKTVPFFNLPQLKNPKHTFSSEQLRGSVVLLNVWASWCAACIEEQVFLMQLAREGVSIYGLNYKDDAKNALQWLEHWGNPYKIIASDVHGTTAIDLGVYGAPETFIIDKQGMIRYRHAGVMTETLWQKEMLPLIKQLEQEPTKLGSVSIPHRVSKDSSLPLLQQDTGAHGQASVRRHSLNLAEEQRV